MFLFQLSLFFIRVSGYKSKGIIICCCFIIPRPRLRLSFASRPPCERGQLCLFSSILPFAFKWEWLQAEGDSIFVFILTLPFNYKGECPTGEGDCCLQYHLFHPLPTQPVPPLRQQSDKFVALDPRLRKAMNAVCVFCTVCATVNVVVG